MPEQPQKSLVARAVQRIFPGSSAQGRPLTADAPRLASAFIEGELRDGDGYRFAAGCPKTLLATAFGVLTHELFGTLAKLSKDRRRELAQAIKSHQGPTGLFRDPLHNDDVIFRLRKFTPLYIEWQETYFALHALDALGEKPDRPLGFVEPFRDPQTLEVWLRTLGFDDFWFSSNYLMFLLTFFLWEEGRKAPSAHRLLDLLDVRQDPATGFWGTQQGASLFNGMAGAYHLYGFYLYLDRPIHHAAAAIESTLKLQEASGLWGDPGGGPCEDLAAVDILAKLEPGSGDQERRVRLSLLRALPALEACDRGGGFVWSSPQRGVKHRRIRYSGLETLSVQTDTVDIWSTWFRPLAIALAYDRLDRPMPFPVTYRRLPLLGWHKASLRGATIRKYEEG
jgi:hypothetical protein